MGISCSLFSIDIIGLVRDYADCPSAFPEIITPLEGIMKIVSENHVSVVGQLIVDIMEKLTFMVDPAETPRRNHTFVPCLSGLY